MQRLFLPIFLPRWSFLSTSTKIVCELVFSLVSSFEFFFVFSSFTHPISRHYAFLKFFCMPYVWLGSSLTLIVLWPWKTRNVRRSYPRLFWIEEIIYSKVNFEVFLVFQMLAKCIFLDISLCWVKPLAWKPLTSMHWRYF